MGKESTAWLYVGDSLKSSAAIETCQGYISSSYCLQNGEINVLVYLQNYSYSDSYTTAYNKRVNYWVKDNITGDIVTQGTMYVSSSTGYERAYTNYSFTAQKGAGRYTLYLESPTRAGAGNGKIEAHSFIVKEV